MTPIACKTAFLESLPKTAGWFIHSSDASSSVSSAFKVMASIAEAWPPMPFSSEPGEGWRSGVATPSPCTLAGALGGLGFPPWGIGGRPPFPSPFIIVRVSFRRWWARSCCPRVTRVNALLSMSEVNNSIRRCTILGWGGIGGVAGLPVFFALGFAGSMVMASKDGRDGWVRVPSRRISPYVKSAWMRGTSSTLKVLCSSLSNGPPSASRPETILSHGSCGRCSWEELSGAMTNWTSMSIVELSERHVLAVRVARDQGLTSLVSESQIS